MTRVSIGDGRWFDNDKVERFEEGTEWNGNTYISLATGSQWEHETLYRTVSGAYILYHWSQWQGSTDSYTVLDKHDAAAWMVRNNHEPHKDVENEYAQLEIK